MKIDPNAVRECLKSFDLKTLFLEHLGWDNLQAPLDIQVNGSVFQLIGIAQKRGFVAFTCPSIPDSSTRLKIDRQVTKFAHEHFIIYADQPSGQQIWQWVRREPSKPCASRERRFDIRQSGEPLIQRLDQIAVSFEEEEGLTVVDVVSRARAAFDMDIVTRRFYDHFKTEHSVFFQHIKGIEADADLQWYTSLMLNRLMFVYFVQKKGFLDGDTNYLRNRLTMVQQSRGKNKFQSFYRYFLLRLFRDGLGMPTHERKLDLEMERLLGKVPYLNGGFFEVHKLEQRYPDIDIPDKAFEKLFDFFDRYSWYLDERPLRADNEINPDVIGYIFEKYINQKQMGAYYTKEDITEYISKNTIVPFIFDAALRQCPTAFKQNSALWKLLQDDPDRYIYQAVRHGVIYPDGSIVPESGLPGFVQTGLHDSNVWIYYDRYNLQQAPAEDPTRLVTETWREYASRRQRCLDIREKLHTGQISQINDLIALNLDVWQFARDAIANAEDPELLHAFWHAIERVTILDPTCGSGAFLFTALRILETLYSDCLERMGQFIGEIADHPNPPKYYSDFKMIRGQISKHPNERYFILKSIVVNNLFGVDIMEEAVEICKLRLFLKLIAQIDRIEDIEPLPDIDFNIRAGNTLVGYTTYNEVRRALHSTLDVDDAMTRIEKNAKKINECYCAFRCKQISDRTQSNTSYKRKLQGALNDLEKELNRYLAREYGVDVDNQPKYTNWLNSYKPFHWFIEYYGIMQSGGFDVVIGNPPYVQKRDITDYNVLNYSSNGCGDIYANVLEQGMKVSVERGRLGFIVPLSCFAVNGFESIQRIYEENTDLLCVSNWSGDAHPARLFEGVDKRLEILIARHARPSGISHIRTTCYTKWYTSERPNLFQIHPIYEVAYPRDKKAFFSQSLPKVGSKVALSIIERLQQFDQTIACKLSKFGNYQIYYTRKVSFFLQFLDFIPEVRDSKGSIRSPSELKVLQFSREAERDVCLALLSSSLFYWFNTINSDCRNLNQREIINFPVPSCIPEKKMVILHNLVTELMEDYVKNSWTKAVSYKNQGIITVQYFNFRASKPIIDKIDREIASLYELTDEELDYILNYDIKYRLGR